MKSVEMKNFSFSYAGNDTPALRDISLSVSKGEFVVLCGLSGSGKTTLLKSLKPSLTPAGSCGGEILFDGRPIETLDRREESSAIGFVMQNPENQIVTDKVWHELSFGLENLGTPAGSIRVRTAETATFFGIQDLFLKPVSQLSGGQKQILNLASIMAMQPSLLLLDEPTSRLDPIAASEFLALVGRINRELGVTVIMSEHRQDEAWPIADRIAVLDEGSLLFCGRPADAGAFLNETLHPMQIAAPTPVRIYGAVKNELECPITVREGRLWLDRIAETRELLPVPARRENRERGQEAICVREAFFKYERNSEDVLRGLSLSVRKGSFTALLGGNGTGKSTLLSLITGENRPYSGYVRTEGRIAALPQEPDRLFTESTLEKELAAGEDDAHIIEMCGLEGLRDRHPYDLSGGEQQRAALAKVLLTKPDILLLDEPTKGLDGSFKRTLAGIIRELTEAGVTVLTVTHDIEFCAEYADRCVLLFGGQITADDEPRAFFSGNGFYTTAANRMARHRLPQAITADEVIAACGGTPPPAPPPRPKRENSPKCTRKVGESVSEGKLSPRDILTAVMLFALIPATILAGIYLLDDRKYAFVSLAVVIESMIPVFFFFERKRPQAKEMVLLATLSGIAAAARVAFFFIPQFKPILAVVIMAAAAFGPRSGFLVGACGMLASNIYFGQGPWTPWQMFAAGAVGFLAGAAVKKGLLPRKRLPLAVFGFIVTVVVYGGIMNPAAVLMFQSSPAPAMFLAAYAAGFPLDLLHAAGTAFFLLLIGEPFLSMLERIRLKYDL